MRDGPILLQRGVIPAPDSAAWLSPPVGGRGQLARDSEMDGSYLLNTDSQNIVQCAAAQRAVTHRRCTKNDTNRRTAICSFHRTVYGTNCQLACYRFGAQLLPSQPPDPPPGHRRGRGGQSDARKPAAFSSAMLIAAASRLNAWSAQIAAPTVRAHPATSRQGCTKNIPKLTACDIWLGAMKPSRSIRLERLGSSDTQGGSFAALILGAPGHGRALRPRRALPGTSGSRRAALPQTGRPSGRGALPTPPFRAAGPSGPVGTAPRLTLCRRAPAPSIRPC